MAVQNGYNCISPVTLPQAAPVQAVAAFGGQVVHSEGFEVDRSLPHRKSVEDERLQMTSSSFRSGSRRLDAAIFLLKLIVDE